MLKTFADLDAWKLAINLTKDIYSLTKGFPKEELFVLTNQMRRAAISIPSNIAEGWSKNSPKDFIRFINIAQGSLSELQTQLIIASELGYFKAEALEKYLSQTKETGNLLGGLKKYLCQKIPN